MSDPTQYQTAYSHRSSSLNRTALVYSHDHATLQVIREFLEPLGFTVEFVPPSDANRVKADWTLTASGGSGLCTPASQATQYWWSTMIARFGRS